MKFHAVASTRRNGSTDNHPVIMPLNYSLSLLTEVISTASRHSASKGIILACVQTRHVRRVNGKSGRTIRAELVGTPTEILHRCSFGMNVQLDRIPKSCALKSEKARLKKERDGGATRGRRKRAKPGKKRRKLDEGVNVAQRKRW